jgi:hypothetical protein
MPALRIIIVVIVALPLFLIVGWPHPLWVTLLIAVFAFGVAHGIDVLVKHRKGSAQSPSTPQSTRAANATLLPEAGEHIRNVLELPGHRRITTTPIDDKRGRQTS